MLVEFFYSHPTWLVGLVVVGVWTGLAVLGLWVFNRFSDPHKREKDTETVGLTYAIVAVVYAVLLALVVVDVWEAFAKADDIAGAESNKLSALLYDTMGLPDAEAKAVRDDLEAYAEMVIKKEWPSQQAGDLEEKNFAEGWTILGRLTSKLALFEPAGLGQSTVKAEMLRSVNDLIKSRRARILAAGDHLPDVIWQILLAAGAVAVFYTYLFGAHSFAIHVSITSLIAATIALIFTLIIALDYPFRGDVSVGPDAFEGVAKSITTFDPGALKGSG